MGISNEGVTNYPSNKM